MPGDEGLDVRVLVRYRDGVPYPGVVVVQHPDHSIGPVTGSTLRSIPMGRLEQALRDPEVQRSLNSNHPSLPDVSPAHLSTSHAVEVLMDITGFTAWVTKPSLRLDVPKRGEPKDTFLARVVEVYNEASKQRPRPAADIAEVNDVATSTVHGWLKEARRRGLKGT
jgi:hypothetical protein